MTGATATRLECPRCGGSVPSWQPLHVRCFVYRVRAVVWVLAVAVVLPVAVYGFRFASVVYERSRVNVAAAGTPADQQSSTTVSPPDTTRSAENVEPRDPVQRKPSPTVMLYHLLHHTKEQILGFKTVLFFKYYKYQKVKNPIAYYKIFRNQWNSSVYWANELKKN